MHRTKISQTEAPTQAHHWTKLHNAARRRGYCDTCAPQLAYGRQHGWLAVREPCTSCAQLAMTDAEAKGWLRPRNSTTNTTTGASRASLALAGL